MPFEYLKAIVVDDEELIRTGLSRRISWEETGYQLAGTASNGEEALQLLQQTQVDVVITDIKMPVMDGIDLIKRAVQKFPRIRFIILSGYEDFSYAKTALSYGIRHYIVKPSNIDEIYTALEELHKEITKERTTEDSYFSMEEALEKEKPMVREFFLKTLLQGIGLNEDEKSYFFQVCGPPPKKIRVILYTPSNIRTFSQITSFKILTERAMNGKKPYLSGIINDRGILIFEDQKIEYRELLQSIPPYIQKIYGQHGYLNISSADSFEQIHNLYTQVLEDSIRSVFYNTVSEKQEAGETGDIEELWRNILQLTEQGEVERLRSKLDAMFRNIRFHKWSKPQVLSRIFSYVKSFPKLYISEHPESFMDTILSIAQSDSVHQIQEKFQGFLISICEEARRLHSSQADILTSRMKAAVEEHLSNSELSLKWLSQKVFNANGDYLGKTFKKTEGVKITAYIRKRRIEEAIRLLSEYPEISMAEVAERCGFHNNNQYFYKVFKSITGMTPGEYRSRN